MKKHQDISIIYIIFLTLGTLLCVGSFIFIPVKTFSANGKAAITELTPTDIISLNEDVREYCFRDVNWKENGNYLHFVSTHQEIKVKADGELIFERDSAKTIWGHTPGFAWEYIEIPINTQEVTVTVTSCYPAIRDASIRFYQGIGVKMIWSLFHQEGFTCIISFLNVCLGVILLMYGTIVRKRSNIGTPMAYLGIFAILLGIWSISDNGITAVLIKNRPACSFVSFTTLALVGIPFIMFVHCYLEPDDKYVYKILLGLNIFNIFLVFFLQCFGIKDMKETLLMTHIAMLAAVCYLPFSLIHMIRKRLITQRFWVTVCSLLSMCPPLIYSLYQYYSGSHNVDSYGNVFIFVFIAIFAIDVSRSIIKDIDAGKKVAIYQELAEKDLLTGCYNRNAYRNDTSNWVNLHGVLLLTCDLNNLKQCNDTLGHAYGDQYITDAADILKKTFSKYGRLYRIGGDEFCIIISDSHKCDIKKLLANMVEAERIYNTTSPVIHLQIACGYAEFDEKTDSNMEDIRNRADEQMYKNKKELKKQKLIS